MRCCKDMSCEKKTFILDKFKTFCNRRFRKTSSKHLFKTFLGHLKNWLYTE